MAETSREAKLRMTLQSLNDADPSLWCEDGSPALEPVARLSGLSHLQRQELNEVGRVRDMSRVDIKRRKPVAVAAPSNDAEAAAEAVSEAQKNLDAAYDGERKANVRLRTARTALSTALAEFQGVVKKDAATVHREGVAREQARKLAIANGKAKDTELPPPEFRSAVDAQAYFSKNKTAGAKYGAFRRGASPIRLPSQR